MLVKRKTLSVLPVFFAFLLASRLPAQAVASASEADAALDAETEEARARQKEWVGSVLSFDLGWLMHGLANNGLALGMNYERLVVPHFSLRGTAGAMFFSIPAMDAYSVDAALSLCANWYPFSDMLDKLYAGIGVTADLLYYFGGDSLPDPPVDAIISLAPTIGWKQNIANIIVLDFFGSYSFLVFSIQRFRSEEYIRNGFQIGARFKILWRPGKYRA